MRRQRVRVLLAMVLLAATGAHERAHGRKPREWTGRRGQVDPFMPADQSNTRSHQFSSTAKILVPMAILALSPLSQMMAGPATPAAPTPAEVLEGRQEQQRARMTFTKQPPPGVVSTSMQSFFGTDASLLSPDIPAGNANPAATSTAGPPPTQDLGLAGTDPYGRITAASPAAAPPGAATGRLFRRQRATGGQTVGPAAPPRIRVSAKAPKPKRSAGPLTDAREEILSPQTLSQQMATTISTEDDRLFNKLAPQSSVLTQLSTASELLGGPSLASVKLNDFNKIMVDHLDNIKYKDAEKTRRELKLDGEPVVHFDLRSRRHLSATPAASDAMQTRETLELTPGAFANPSPYNSLGGLEEVEHEQEKALGVGQPFTIDHLVS